MSLQTAVFIDSFGARWQDPPPARCRAAVLSVNLTDRLLNPPDDTDVGDDLVHQTGRDPAVRHYVLGTPSAVRIITDATHELLALRAASPDRPVQLLVSCWYGKHRAPAIAEAVGRELERAGARVQVTHRHINRPPVPRKHPRDDCRICRILRDEVHAEVIHRWGDALAIAPRTSVCTGGHVLILPRGHVADLATDPVVSAAVQLRAAELAGRLDGPWTYHTACPSNAAPPHLHGHLVRHTAADENPRPADPRITPGEPA